MLLCAFPGGTSFHDVRRLLRQASSTVTSLRTAQVIDLRTAPLRYRYADMPAPRAARTLAPCSRRYARARTTNEVDVLGRVT